MLHDHHSINNSNLIKYILNEIYKFYPRAIVHFSYYSLTLDTINSNQAYLSRFFHLNLLYIPTLAQFIYFECFFNTRVQIYLSIFSAIPIILIFEIILIIRLYNITCFYIWYYFHFT